MPLYRVVAPLKFDGERHEVDAELELTAKQAEPLLKSGSLVQVEKPADSKKKPADK